MITKNNRRERYAPFTSKEIQVIEALLLKHYGSQMKDIFRLGILLGIRMDALLKLKFNDFHRADGSGFSTYQSTKTSNSSSFSITIAAEAADIISNLQKENPTSTYIFQYSDRLSSEIVDPKSISRRMVDEAFRNVGRMLSEESSGRSMMYVFAKNYSKR